MPGNTIGGKKAAAKNLANDPLFYKKIGKIGGMNGRTGGFSVDIECNCDEIKRPHYKRQCAGARGGRVSRRKS